MGSKCGDTRSKIRSAAQLTDSEPSNPKFSDAQHPCITFWRSSQLARLESPSEDCFRQRGLTLGLKFSATAIACQVQLSSSLVRPPDRVKARLVTVLSTSTEVLSSGLPARSGLVKEAAAVALGLQLQRQLWLLTFLPVQQRFLSLWS